MRSTCSAVSRPSTVTSMPSVRARAETVRTISSLRRVAVRGDERAVDLERVERELAQGAERRVAGAEIVEADADPGRAQLAPAAPPRPRRCR